MKLQILVSLLLILLGPTLTWATTLEGDAYETLEITLPGGDAEAGRKAFIELSCISCHTVSGEDSELPVSAHPGPALDSMLAANARLDPGSIASSIVSPSHTITLHNGEPREGSLSSMGDFSDAMTLRQLIDLVAYLRSPDEGR